MSAIINNQVFEGSNTGIRKVTLDVPSGSATLQSLNGNDPDNDAWIDEDDGAYTADAGFCMHCPPGTKFRWVLTGGASGWMSA